MTEASRPVEPASPATTALETGVPNLDRVLGGRLLAGAVVLVVGPPGAGKTMLGQQVAFHRARQGDPVLYLTGYSETHDKLVAHNRGLHFFDPALLGSLIQLGSLPDLLGQGADEAEKVVVRTARQQGARLVVLDGFRSLRRLVGPEPAEAVEPARWLYRLGAQLALLGATTIVLVEGDPDNTDELPELTVGDVVINLRRAFLGMRQRRLLDVRKVRGGAPLSGLHVYELDNDGFTVWPRLETWTVAAEPPWSNQRAELGIPALDELLHGGLTAGTTTVAAGGPGTGKTLLGLHFLAEGARLGEPSLFLGFRESAVQLRAKARDFGLDLNDTGERLRLLVLPGHDLEADRVAEILRQDVDRRGVRRLVIDSASHMHRAIADPIRTLDFFVALVAYLRARQVTTYLPFEIAKVVGQELDFSDTPLSVLAENLLLLRHVEYRGALHRVISVLQMRFSSFDKTIREFSIEAGQGLVLSNEVLAADGVLTGSPRLILPERSRSNAMSHASPQHPRVAAIILIVDDEAPIRDLLALVLQDLGHRVVTAIDGRQALTVATSERPDLVISDVMMPAMGGVELTRRLKAGEAGAPAAPVILMSSAGPAAARGANADAFIEKPFDLDAMQELVARWVGSR